MAIIGTFKASKDGFTGSIKTLSVDARVRLAKTEKTSAAAPDYRVYAGSLELGAAWAETARDGRAYLSVKLDDPSFPAPIQAALIASERDDSHALLWSRRAGG